MIAASSKFSPQTASTTSVDAREQLDYWRRVVVDNYVDVEIESPASLAPEAGFQGTMRRIVFGGCAIDEVAAEPLRVNRSPASIRRSPGDYYQVALLLSGGAMVMQDGRTGPLNLPGDFCLLDAEKPYVFAFLSDLTRHAFFKVPKEFVEAQYSDVDALTGITVSADGGIARLAAQTLQSLSEVDESRFDQASFGATASSLALTITALREKCGNGPESRPGEVLLAEAQAYIGRNLADADSVSPREIAAAVSISERYLYKLFKQQGTSPGRWARELRLSQASAILRDPADPRSIKEIAHSLGFRSSAQFSRTFAAHFGRSPSEMKAQARSGELLG